MYSEREVEALLGESGSFYRLQVTGECGSTNEEIKRLAAAGAGEEGLTLAADRQAWGKGSRGRSFHSPAGTGIYVSTLLFPKGTPEDILLLTPAAAVAASRGILKGCGVETGIKWVNDLYAGGRKVCGILAEAVRVPGRDCTAVVLGVGINVFPPDEGFPEEIRNRAGTLLDRRGPDGDRIRASVLAGYLSELYGIYKSLPDRSFLEEYRERSILIGKTVTVSDPNGEREATVLDIDRDAHLSVRFRDGSEKLLFAGEVTLRLA